MWWFKKNITPKNKEEVTAKSNDKPAVLNEKHVNRFKKIKGGWTIIGLGSNYKEGESDFRTV